MNIPAVLRFPQHLDIWRDITPSIASTTRTNSSTSQFPDSIWCVQHSRCLQHEW